MNNEMEWMEEFKMKKILDKNEKVKSSRTRIVNLCENVTIDQWSYHVHT